MEQKPWSPWPCPLHSKLAKNHRKGLYLQSRFGFTGEPIVLGKQIVFSLFQGKTKINTKGFLFDTSWSPPLCNPEKKKKNSSIHKAIDFAQRDYLHSWHKKFNFFWKPRGGRDGEQLARYPGKINNKHSDLSQIKWPDQRLKARKWKARARKWKAKDIEQKRNQHFLNFHHFGQKPTSKIGALQ